MKGEAESRKKQNGGIEESNGMEVEENQRKKGGTVEGNEVKESRRPVYTRPPWK